MFVQNVHNAKWMSSIPCSLPADFIRVSQGFVTSGDHATSASEQPSFLTPIHDSLSRRMRSLFNWGEAYFSGAANLKIAQLRL